MSQSMPIVVKKFGGSSVATPEKIKQVAGFIKSTIKTGEKYLVVVSAMGKTTNELLALAKEISDHPCKREQDMLVSCGERTSMALLAMALKDINVKSLSLTGSQSGIITDNVHGGANIEVIKPFRVREAFSEHDVVIIAGFQGVSHDKEVTTLRRGGSDTTAVAMAKALDAVACEIYTDVPGIMTADPNLYPHAQILPVVSFQEASSMALYGAKVLAYDAALLALEHQVPLKIAETLSKNQGTRVEGCDFKNRLKPVLAISHITSLCHFALPLSDFLGLDLSLSDASFAYVHGETVVGYVTQAKTNLAPWSSIVLPTGTYALVTLHVEQDARDEVMDRAVNLLFKHGIMLKAMQQQLNQILLIVNDDDCATSVKLLHQGLIEQWVKRA